MAEKFKIGDIVQLKSGGPKMTVNSVTMETIYCAWFAGAKRESASFSAEALVMAPEEKPKK